MFVRARMCLCACLRIPLSYPEMSVIPVHLFLKIDFMKYKQDKSIADTPLFQYFDIWKAPSSLLLKCWCLGNPKKNMYGLNVKELPNNILTQANLFFILRVGATD